MGFTNSPNMALPVPGVGTEPGPQYASDINSCLSILDAHTHTPGNGVQIVPAAININSVLTFNNNPASALQYVAMTTQASAITVTGSLYVKLGSEGTPRPDLWYYDGTTAVQITSGGATYAPTATISGISYAGGAFTFTRAQDSLPTTPADLSVGSVTFRPDTAGTTNGLTLSTSALTSAYTLTVPAAIATQTGQWLTSDTSGALSWTGVDNSTLQYSANILSVKSGGITATQIANATITATQIASGTITATQMAANSVGTSQLVTGSVTPVKLATQNAAISNSCGTFTTSSGSFVNITQLALNVTNTSRPFMIFTQSDGQSGDAAIDAAGSGLRIRLLRGATEIARTIYGPSGSFGCTFMAYDPVSPGSYTYTLQAESINGSTVQTIQNIVLVIYEMA